MVVITQDLISHQIDCLAAVNQHVTLEILGTGRAGEQGELWSREIYLVFFTEMILKFKCLLPANLERLSKMPFLAKSSGTRNMMVLKATLP